MNVAARLKQVLWVTFSLLLIGCALVLLFSVRTNPGALALVGGIGLSALAVGVVLLGNRESQHRQGLSGAPGRMILDAIGDAVFIVSYDGAILEMNGHASRELGMELDRVAGKFLSSFFKDSEGVSVALDRTRSRGILRDHPVAFRSQQNHEADVELTASLIPGEGNALPRLLVRIREAGSDRRTAAAAVERGNYLRSLLEAAADPLFAINPAGRLTDVNLATVKKTGIEFDRLVGADFSSLFTKPEEARTVCERILGEGRVQDCPLTIKHRDGSLTEVLFNGTLYRDSSGETVGIFASARDHTQALKAQAERAAKEWVMVGIARLNRVFQDSGVSLDLRQRIISELAEYTGSQVGGFYASENQGAEESLVLVASHAYTRRKGISNRFLRGEGLVGQAALERRQIVLSQVPEDYIQIGSGLGEAKPRSLCLTPLIYEGSVRGMIELATFGQFSDAALEFLQQATPSIAVAMEAAISRERVDAALRKSQLLATELEAQQETLQNANKVLETQKEALNSTNAELEEQTAALKLSEDKLRSQQTEIELSNSELNTKNELLERQKRETDEARKILAQQAEEVALASKYKSEFLANMSHELRTPLNSLLLLARSLRDNPTKNLSPDQVEAATVIFESGSDLLNLINDILDLSKVEAGKMDLRLEPVQLSDLQRALLSQFDHMARAQGLDFQVAIDPDAPESIFSDSQRLGQVIKNLVGNAIKFTEHGRVSVKFARPLPGIVFTRSGLDPHQVLAIHVADSGIGIPVEKQRLIFEAFQQADSGDRRRFGGTGLGLSISRELTSLLGGEIQLVSTPGKGSTFTLYLPMSAPRGRESETAERRGLKHSAPEDPSASKALSPMPSTVAVDDDRTAIGDSDHVILVIEDDIRFAKILCSSIRERHLKCLLATSGEEGLELARLHRVDGIILDIQLPKKDGWSVLHSLKQAVPLRHIPVHIISVEEFSAQNLRLGAIGQATKPITHEGIDEVLRRLQSASSDTRKRVLVLEDDPLMRRELVRIVADETVSVVEAGSGREAMEALRKEQFHLVVMDLGLPDMQGSDLLKQVAAEKLVLPPVIVHTVRELTTEEQYFLRTYADSIIVKDVRSQERLIDEVALFLHRVVRDLPEEKRRAILHLHESDEPLRGRKVLIVEDDMRTMFAMARLLAGHGMIPLKAENGERALAVMHENPGLDVVLMDMMMPTMDGYEAIRRLRDDARFQKLPVVALTAKAMKEDRQRCLESGATDYLSKPVDPERLVSLLRVLLCR